MRAKHPYPLCPQHYVKCNIIFITKKLIKA